jgi:hypothetical protein
VLVGDGLLDRSAADLAAIRYHLLVADEALRYANPDTEAHRASSSCGWRRRPTAGC